MQILRTFGLAAVAAVPLLAARGENLAAFGAPNAVCRVGDPFDGRCIPAGCVAPPSNTAGILGRRALPPGRVARLGATPDFHHGLLDAPARSGPVLVTAVFDGDTIVVATVGHVRLLGIDAPEVGRVFDTPAPFGLEAKDRLTQLVLHRWVRLEQDGPRTDGYGRHLAYVLLEDGTLVNGVLVREGLARISARVPLARLPELQRAEADAQALRRGMWGNTPKIPAPTYTQRVAKPSPKVRTKKPRATPGVRKKGKKKADVD